MKFLRTDYWRHSRLGKKRKKLQKWRKARGMHNKIRDKRRGYSAKPSVGYRTKSGSKGKVKNLNPVLVHNIKQLNSIKKGEGAVIAKIGARKKIELLRKAEEMKIHILNIRTGDRK